MKKTTFILMATAIYKALGVEATSRVAVKVSTGEGSNPNYLKPELIKDLVHEVDGTIVECNTAYGNGPGDEKDERNNSANHWEVIRRHGFTDSNGKAYIHSSGKMEKLDMAKLVWTSSTTKK